jgi:hypothetical protein
VLVVQCRHPIPFSITPCLRRLRLLAMSSSCHCRQFIVVKIVCDAACLPDELEFIMTSPAVGEVQKHVSLCLQDIDCMLSRFPYIALYSIHRLGETIIFLKKQGLQNAHILGIARRAPEVFTRSLLGVRSERHATCRGVLAQTSVHTSWKNAC